MSVQRPRQSTSPPSTGPDEKSATKSPESLTVVTKLSQHYGGQHIAGWVDSLPAHWIPYIQLARLSPPVGVCLVLFPHIFGLLHGIILVTSPETRLRSVTCALLTHITSLLWLRDDPLATAGKATVSKSVAQSFSSSVRALSDAAPYPAVLLVAGSFFLSNAIHGWNDLIDAPYDALMERTRGRPVVRGAVSKTGALIFTLSQTIASAMLLLIMIPDPARAVRVAWPGALVGIYYPFAKRHTHFAQYVLGVHLAWGVVVGTNAVFESANDDRGVKAWEGTQWASTACLTAASALWTVIYDTIYAFQDREDDIKAGLKSTAVLFGDWTKVFLGLNLALLTGLLAYIGSLSQWGPLYDVFAVGGCVLSLGVMIIKVDLMDAVSCWWWFRYGFWLAGGSITLGLLSEC